MYKLIYSNRFTEDLEALIFEWEVELAFSSKKIKKFIQAIDYSLRMVSEFPEMYEDIAVVYGLHTPTYRILIGKQYAIFYRLNHVSKEVLIGSIFNQKQMRLTF